ncbi:MAG: ABC transporter permease [Candidatus Thiodiazotropha sp. (ex. Lucinisca nassula)]|nr:ABC transporter permease [Candidatus Thiodiazotropha sp. (ex. Lucinisca nassula)]
MAVTTRFRSFLLLVLLGYAPSCLSHGVGLKIERQEAAVIWLHHTDDTPLADVAYELTADGGNAPYQSGKSDASGRVVFIPGDVRGWRLRVFSEDGHGIDTVLELAPGMASHSHTGHTYSELTKLILGIGILLSGFGVMMLFTKRKRR